MKFRPLNDHVIITPLVKEEKTETGIIVQQGIESHYARGTILSCNEQYQGDSGHWIKTQVNVGDEVLYPVRGVTPMRINGQDIVLAKVGALVGVFS